MLFSTPTTKRIGFTLLLVFEIYNRMDIGRIEVSFVLSLTSNNVYTYFLFENFSTIEYFYIRVSTIKPVSIMNKYQPN